MDASPTRSMHKKTDGQQAAIRILLECILVLKDKYDAARTTNLEKEFRELLLTLLFWTLCDGAKVGVGVIGGLYLVLYVHPVRLR